MENKKVPKLCSDKLCTGCMACLNSCNKSAIIQIQNKEGFYRPQLIVDKCVGCLLCERHCPILNPIIRDNTQDVKVYAAWNKDEEIRNQSSSGGAFSAIAETILDIGGVIVGAEYTTNLYIKHTIIYKKADLNRLMLSKYAQSSINDTFVKIKQLLCEEKYVLFVGTACQVMGLHSYLGKKFEKLITADIICHGVPSISFLQSYKKWLEKIYGNIIWINFRDKQKGWYDNLRTVKTSNGNLFSLKGEYDAYWAAFSRNTCLQESCYNCKAQGFPRCSDITLADFWKIGYKIPFEHKKEIEKGISMIIVNSRDKQWVIEKSTDKLYLERRTFEEAIGGNISGIKSCIRPSERENFYNDLITMEFQSFRHKYMKFSRKEWLVKLFREHMPYELIKIIRLTKQK